MRPSPCPYCGRCDFFHSQVVLTPAWQSISSAPKDGTHIIVIRESDPQHIPATVHWFDGGWHLSVNQRGEYSEYIWGTPTHWMPCPSFQPKEQP
jgi:hypothetical protein